MALQDNFGWLIDQTKTQQARAYRIPHPDIQYSRLVPVDTSANEWTNGVTHYSYDGVGEARLLTAMANDMPMADIVGAEHTVGVETAGIGYQYSLHEVEKARLIPGNNLDATKAIFARRAAEQFIDNIVLNGSSAQSWDGLKNHSSIPKADAPNRAAAATSSITGDALRYWKNKTGDEVVKDINEGIIRVWADSNQVEYADTMLLPPAAFAYITSTPRSSTSDTTIATYVREQNVMTATTGRQLTIGVMRGLEE